MDKWVVDMIGDKDVVDIVDRGLGIADRGQGTFLLRIVVVFAIPVVR